MDLTEEQQAAHDMIVEWILRYDRDEDLYISLGGLAGTGKTTILAVLSETMSNSYTFKSAFCTFTGRASLVLRNKMIKRGSLYEDDYCGTIHSLIYKPILDENKDIIGWDNRDPSEINYDVIFVDESSMVSDEIWNDLHSYNKPIVAIGDHGQLPPVSKDDFNIMDNPDIKIETIHRQALDNPIIKLSMCARNNEFIDFGSHGNGVHKISWSDKIQTSLFNNINMNDDLIFLCGTNRTRVRLNKLTRLSTNRVGTFPEVGEKIICLKNNKTINIMNGQLATLTSCTPIGKGYMVIDYMPDGERFNLTSITHRDFFHQTDSGKSIKFLNEPSTIRFMDKWPHLTLDVFDYGYCTTVHKAQGGEWNKVILFDERTRYQTDDIYRRWLYTGITRAVEKLYIVTRF